MKITLCFHDAGLFTSEAGTNFSSVEIFSNEQQEKERFFFTKRFKFVSLALWADGDYLTETEYEQYRATYKKNKIN